MKKLFSAMVFVMAGFFAANAQTDQKAPEQPKSAVKFTETTYDFGEVAYNSDVSHSFNFKNISHSPVAVKDVQTSCGCTTPGYSKEPVMPGKTGSVTAKYDSSRIGAFTKTLTVHINDETIYLTIKGVIKEPKTDGK